MKKISKNKIFFTYALFIVIFLILLILVVIFSGTKMINNIRKRRKQVDRKKGICRQK